MDVSKISAKITGTTTTEFGKRSEKSYVMTDRLLRRVGHRLLFTWHQWWWRRWLIAVVGVTVNCATARRSRSTEPLQERKLPRTKWHEVVHALSAFYRVVICACHYFLYGSSLHAKAPLSWAWQDQNLNYCVAL